MYFWKIDILKQRLIDNGLSENSAFKYILLYTGITSLLMELSSYLPLELVNNWDYISSILVVIISLVGTMYAYKSNGSDTGKDFLARYLSISFVMVIKYTLYLVPVFTVLIIYYGIIFSLEDDVEIYTTPFEVVIFSAWYIALNYSIAKHVNDVAKA